MKNKIVAVVGMCGSGKSEVTNLFLKNNYQRVYFGDVTFDELKKRNLPLNWENEKLIREEFRASGDMGIYAKLNAPKIKDLYKNSNVVVESLYSWSEYKYLKEIYDNDFYVVAVVTDRAVRESRLSTREKRPMTIEDVKNRDYSEIENLEKGGPIVRADFYIINNGNYEEMVKQAQKIIKRLK